MNIFFNRQRVQSAAFIFVDFSVLKVALYIYIYMFYFLRIHIFARSCKCHTKNGISFNAYADENHSHVN